MEEADKMKHIKSFSKIFESVDLTKLSPEVKRRITAYANDSDNQDTNMDILANDIANKPEYGNLSVEDAKDVLFRALISSL